MTNLFLNITDKNKEKILKLLETHTLSFSKGIDVLPTIIGQNNICLIESGSVEIIKEDYDGTRNIIETIREGEVFGSKMSLMDNDFYKIITSDDTTIIIIDYENVINLENVKYDYYIDFLKNLLLIMNDKNKEKNERIEILTKRSTRDKLLEYFRIEAKRIGTNVIYLPFTFTDLADYLAVDRSAMSRELKYLKEDGIIDVNGKRIKLNTYENEKWL